MTGSGTGRGKRCDAALLREAGTDPAAFSELYRRHVGAVYDWLGRRIEWAASDLTAETFARAWLIRDRFRDEHEGSVLPWLLVIAGNLLADAARHGRIETRARERLGLPLDLSRDDSYTEVEQRLSPRLALERHVQALAPHERGALELRVVEELSYEQVAQRLAIRPAAVGCASRARCVGLRSPSPRRSHEQRTAPQPDPSVTSSSTRSVASSPPKPRA